jgi:geranylgeranyl pyrophosphate synthase
MDYKMLHGEGSQAVSSRSIAEREGTQFSVVEDLQATVPEGLFEFVERVEKRLVEVAERAPVKLVGPALEALTSGGKRLRPMLLVLSARIGEPDEEALLKAATAIEVLHTATLVHDDIVDGAALRRGLPTTTAKWGPEVAVATGDYLFAETFYDLAQIGDPRLIRAFAEASEGLAVGEIAQYRSSGTEVEVGAYMDHIHKKTAGLFKVACVAGGTLGGLSLREIDALATYGQGLGLAFQMSDDIMDLVGKPGLMGKGIGTDLVEGTVTLPIIFALAQGDAATIRRVLAAPDPSPALLEAGIEAVLATDAVARTEAWARGEISAAVDGLDLLPDGPERGFLEAVAAEVVGRDV